MTAAALSLSLSGSVLLYAAALLLALAGAWFFYRITLPPLPSGLRLTLSALRGLALGLLLLLLFEPVARLTTTNTQEPVVAVLVDDSQSMTIRDAAGDRAASVRSFLAKGAAPNGASLRYAAFAQGLRSALLDAPDSISFAGETTNLAAALAALKERVVRENVQAVVLVTDGNYTEGKNPLYDAEALGLPVSTVGVGDTAEQKDLLVERLIANSIAYVGGRVPVDVTIKSSGFGGENVEVRLLEGTTVLDRRTLALRPGTVEYALTLSLEAKEEGVRKFSVSVSELPKELTVRNNARSFFVKVLRSKLRILVLGGAPSADVAAVRQALSEDPQFEVNALVQKAPGEFYGRYDRALIDSADCVALVGFPTAITPDAALADVRRALAERRLPILYVHGPRVDAAKLRALEPFLPFSWQPGAAGEVLVAAAVAERARTHPLVHFEGAAGAPSWPGLPPVYKPQSPFRIRPEAELLASASLREIVLDEPLASVRNVNRERSFALTCYGIWRWRLMTQGKGEAAGFLPALLGNAVRWLTTKDDAKSVRVTPVKEAFTTAEPVEFTGQVYDEQLRPVDDAELLVDVARGAERSRLALTAIGNGRYEGSITGLGQGDYTFTAKAVGGGREYGADRGRFTVGEMNVEFLETKMNRSLLEQIAYRTGGTFAPIGAAGSPGALAQGRAFSAREIVQARELELWNSQILAGLILALLALEWFLRKKSGMI